MPVWKEPLTAKHAESAVASAERFNTAVLGFISTHPLRPDDALHEIRDEVLKEAFHQGLPSPITLWLVNDFNNTVGFVCRTMHDDGNKVAVYVEKVEPGGARPTFEVGVQILPPAPKV